VFDEGSQERAGTLNTATVMAGGRSQRGEVAKSSVCERIGLEVGPEELRGVQFGRVGREEEWVKTGCLREEMPGEGGPVCIEAIPEQNDMAWQFAQQLPKKPDDFRTTDVGVHMQTEIQFDVFA
jgi:hypothetical protein